MDNASAVGIGDVVGNQNLPGVFDVKFALVCIEVKDALITNAVELFAKHLVADSSVGLIDAFKPKLLEMVWNQGCCQ